MAIFLQSNLVISYLTDRNLSQWLNRCRLINLEAPDLHFIDNVLRLAWFINQNCKIEVFFSGVIETSSVAWRKKWWFSVGPTFFVVIVEFWSVYLWSVAYLSQVAVKFSPVFNHLSPHFLPVTIKGFSYCFSFVLFKLKLASRWLLEKRGDLKALSKWLLFVASWALSERISYFERQSNYSRLKETLIHCFFAHTKQLSWYRLTSWRRLCWIWQVGWFSWAGWKKNLRILCFT